METDMPDLYRIWYQLHRGTYIFMSLGFVLALFNLYLASMDRNGGLFILIFVGGLFYLPAGLVILFLVRKSTMRVHEGKSLSRIGVLFTDIIIVAVAMSILDELLATNTLGEVIILGMLVIYPLFTIVTLFFSGTTKQYLREHRHEDIA